jgi:hypothetical protein
MRAGVGTAVILIAASIIRDRVMLSATALVGPSARWSAGCSRARLRQAPRASLTLRATSGSVTRRIAATTAACSIGCSVRLSRRSSKKESLRLILPCLESRRTALEIRSGPAACRPVGALPGAGPRGVSKTQSSVKNDMIASTSWALNASSNACSDGVPASVLDMSWPPGRERDVSLAHPHPGQLEGKKVGGRPASSIAATAWTNRSSRRPSARAPPLREHQHSRRRGGCR